MSIHVLLVFFFCPLILYFQDNNNVKNKDNTHRTNYAPCLSQAFSNKDQRIHAVSDTHYLYIKLTCSSIIKKKHWNPKSLHLMGRYKLGV